MRGFAATRRLSGLMGGAGHGGVQLARYLAVIVQDVDSLGLFPQRPGGRPLRPGEGSRPASRSRGVIAPGLMTWSCLRAAT